MKIVLVMRNWILLYCEEKVVYKCNGRIINYRASCMSAVIQIMYFFVLLTDHNEGQIKQNADSRKQSR